MICMVLYRAFLRRCQQSLTSILTRLAQDVQFLKFDMGVPIAAAPPVATKPPCENTPYMTTNVNYWHNSHGGTVGRAVLANGNGGHRHLSPPIEDNATPMEINEDVNMVGEPSNEGVAIKVPFEG